MLAVMSHKSIIIAAVLLQACTAQSSIQANYMAEQDECRALVQRQLSATPTMSGDAAALSAGARFSECMNKVGWNVSVPRPGGSTQMAQNPPTGSPSTNPSAALSTTLSPPATGGIAPSEGTATIARAPVANPPSGAPSVNPSAAAARVAPPPTPAAATTPAPAATSGPAPATYQPSATPIYGQGAGRQF
jgi:hypothetical protein